VVELDSEELAAQVHSSVSSQKRGKEIDRWTEDF
jgi:hypothetical protein